VSYFGSATITFGVLPLTYLCNLQIGVRLRLGELAFEMTLAEGLSVERVLFHATFATVGSFFSSAFRATLTPHPPLLHAALLLNRTTVLTESHRCVKFAACD
jgi:hypothetical protein